MVTNEEEKRAVNITAKQKVINFYHQYQLLFRTMYLVLAFFAFDVLYYYQLGISFNVVRIFFIVLYAFLIASLTFSTKYKKMSISSYIIIFLIVSLIYFGESAYYQVFGQFVTVKDINRMNELQGLGGSVFSYFRKSDILYLFPLIVFIVIDFIVNRVSRNESFTSQEKTISIIRSVSIKSIAIVLIVFAHLLSVTVFSDMNKRYILNTTQYATNYGVLDMVTNQTRRMVFGGGKELSEDAFFTEFAYEQETNEFTGIYEGKNLVFVTAESVSNKALDPKISPIMYQMSQEGIHFENYYSTRPSTPNSEYAMLNSFYLTGEKENEIYTDNGSLPGLLKSQGYTTHAYHSFYKDVYNRETHYPEFGFDTFHDVVDLDIPAKGDWLDFPRDDLLFEKSFPVFENDEQFFNYYLTVSPHGPFKDRETLQDMLPTIRENFPDASEELQAYYAGVAITDLGIEILMQGLEERGVLDNTVFVIVGDHYPYTLSDEAQREIGFLDDLDTAKVPLIIWDASKPTLKKEMSAVNVDILPTLSNMFNLDLQLAMGVDLLSSKGNNSLGEWHDFRDFSYVTSEGGYDAKHNQYTGTLTDEEKQALEEKTFVRYQLNEMELDIRKRQAIA